MRDEEFLKYPKDNLMKYAYFIIVTLFNLFFISEIEFKLNLIVKIIF